MGHADESNEVQATSQQKPSQQEPSQQEPSQQKRGRKIAMTTADLDTFLGEERTCRVATVSPAGVHNTPLWFVWDGTSLWLTSIVRSQRWVDLERDPRVAVVVDAGVEYTELRGAELTGSVVPVGPVPRVEGAEVDGELAAIEQRFANKYSGGTIVIDGRHAWLRLTPDKIVSWDFRKAFA